MIFSIMKKSIKIREHITPKGDGNSINFTGSFSCVKIREHITPKGDGNIITYFQ